MLGLCFYVSVKGAASDSLDCMYMFSLLWYRTLKYSHPIGLCKILPLPILFFVWHIKGESRGRRILCNSRAIVLQWCGPYRWGGHIKGWLIRALQPRSERISCKGQPTQRDPSSVSSSAFKPAHKWRNSSVWRPWITPSWRHFFLIPHIQYQRSCFSFKKNRQVLLTPRTNDEIRLCEGRGFSRLFLLMCFIVRASLTHSQQQAEHRVKPFYLFLFRQVLCNPRTNDEIRLCGGRGFSRFSCVLSCFVVFFGYTHTTSRAQRETNVSLFCLWKVFKPAHKWRNPAVLRPRLQPTIPFNLFHCSSLPHTLSTTSWAQSETFLPFSFSSGAFKQAHKWRNPALWRPRLEPTIHFNVFHCSSLPHTLSTTSWAQSETFLPFPFSSGAL